MCRLKYSFTSQFQPKMVSSSLSVRFENVHFFGARAVRGVCPGCQERIKRTSAILGLPIVLCKAGPQLPHCPRRSHARKYHLNAPPWSEEEHVDPRHVTRLLAFSPSKHSLSRWECPGLTQEHHHHPRFKALKNVPGASTVTVLAAAATDAGDEEGNDEDDVVVELEDEEFDNCIQEEALRLLEWPMVCKQVGFHNQVLRSEQQALMASTRWSHEKRVSKVAHSGSSAPLTLSNESTTTTELLTLHSGLYMHQQSDVCVCRSLSLLLPPLQWQLPGMAGSASATLQAKVASFLLKRWRPASVLFLSKGSRTFGRWYRRRPQDNPAK